MNEKNIWNVFWGNEMELFWNEIELFGIKMNEKECSRSVPIRNVPLHRKDICHQHTNQYV